MKNQIITKLVVVAAVAAVALFTGCNKQEGHAEDDGHGHAGHQHDAKAAAPGEAVSAQAALSGVKCAAHDAPKELCFICNASLRENGRLWCKEHDRYEDRCWLCHPEAQDKQRLFCKEHSLYEDECFLCHPEVKKKGA